MNKKTTILAILSLLLILAGGFYLWRFNGSRHLVQRPFIEELLGTKELAVKTENEIAFTVVGDIMLSRNVAGKIDRAGDPMLPFANVSAFLSETDFNVANLESPFSGRDDYNPTGSLVFNAPTETIAGLKRNNFKVLSLANNHALDQGKNGVIFTRKYLSESGIEAVGAGAGQAEAWKPAVVEVRGVKIGFLGISYASVNDGGKTSNAFVARIEDTTRMQAAISDLKSKSDAVVVLMHAGTEYTHTPNDSQRTAARAAIDFGADLVIGAHPHWVQTIEKYTAKFSSSSDKENVQGVGRAAPHTGLIFYSLGNFIFDQEWSQKTKEGLAVTITIKNKKISSAVLQPVIIENYCCPRLADEKESQTILRSINASSTLITF